MKLCLCLINETSRERLCLQCAVTSAHVELLSDELWESVCGGGGGGSLQ